MSQGKTVSMGIIYTLASIPYLAIGLSTYEIKLHCFGSSFLDLAWFVLFCFTAYQSELVTESPQDF